MKTCTKKDLMAMGFGEYQARRIILKAKTLVKQGYDFYSGCKVGRVPAWMVEEIVGFELPTKEQG